MVPGRKREGDRCSCSIAPEGEGGRIHAEPTVGGGRTIIEYMAEMGVAPRAKHFYPHQTIGGVIRSTDIQVGEWCRKAGPPGS